jgi:hypothetical protein
VRDRDDFAGSRVDVRDPLVVGDVHLRADHKELRYREQRPGIPGSVGPDVGRGGAGHGDHPRRRAPPQQVEQEVGQKEPVRRGSGSPSSPHELITRRTRRFNGSSGLYPFALK